ncbi:hypothetical protein CAEBREN_01755 [Caenorhabditis brenneri]|uniref:Uncharacterized protein n=1 Tax=Caenorhabditis brenneri TaxID=135651 RepID=G0NTS8_CAEBE|nr:hypothetical protein CAEBREN_01755 [Caenorhabditis brenneri]
MPTRNCEYTRVATYDQQEGQLPTLVDRTHTSKFRHDKTVWAACRAVIFGCIIIVVGLAMTILGYFDKYFSEKIEIIDGSEQVTYDRMIQYQLKSMQYLGPILMGIGSFILIIACVVTLESRDKHAQIITEESILQKRRRLISEEEEKAEHNDVFIDDDEDKEPYFGDGRRFVTMDANRLAPLADVDSLTDISLTQRGGSESRLQSEDVTAPPDSSDLPESDRFFQENEETVEDPDDHQPSTSNLPSTSVEIQYSEDLPLVPDDQADDHEIPKELPKNGTNLEQPLEPVEPKNEEDSEPESPRRAKLRLEILASEME